SNVGQFGGAAIGNGALDAIEGKKARAFIMSLGQFRGKLGDLDGFAVRARVVSAGHIALRWFERRTSGSTRTRSRVSPKTSASSVARPFLWLKSPLAITTTGVDGLWAWTSSVMRLS